MRLKVGLEKGKREILLTQEVAVTHVSVTYVSVTHVSVTHLWQPLRRGFSTIKMRPLVTRVSRSIWASFRNS